MRYPQRSLLRSAGRYAGAAALVLAVSCSLTDDDDEDGGGDSNANAGTAGQVVMLGGRSQGGGANTAGEGNSTGGMPGSGPAACQDLKAGECGGSSVAANFKTVNILLVIDKSASMEDTPSGFEDSKWDSLKQALDEALNRVAPDINFGLVLYPFSRVEPIGNPSCGDRCCEVPVGVQAINVPVEPGLDSVPKILGALDGTGPGGGTPTSAALQAAYEYFTVGDGADLQGERYVLLATDGGPNCNAALSCEADRCTTNLDGMQPSCEGKNCCAGKLGDRCLDDEEVTRQVEALAAENIPTFVVGIPGTEQYSTYLDAIASVSGVPNEVGPNQYYRVDADGGVEGLVDVFSSITTQLVRACDIELASAPLDLEKVNVYIDCEIVPRGEGEDEQWEVEATGDTGLVHLKGDTCRRIERSGAERVDVTFGCPSIR